MAFAFGRLVFSRCSRRAVHEPLPGGWRRNLSIASPATGPFSGRPLRNAKRPIDYLPAAVAIEPAPLQYRTSRLRAVRPNMVDSGESNNSVDEQPARWQEVQIPTPWGHLAGIPSFFWGHSGLDRSPDCRVDDSQGLGAARLRTPGAGAPRLAGQRRHLRQADGAPP